MAATRVYSTAAYWIAAAVAIVLALCPKIGAVISAIPPGVLGGATIVLYGLVGILGVRIWLTNHVDFSQPINQMTAAIPLIIGIADFTWHGRETDLHGHRAWLDRRAGDLPRHAAAGLADGQARRRRNRARKGDVWRLPVRHG